MIDEALILHLANQLAALEQSRAAASTASPTWRGVDAVEAATREVIAAAHAVVAGYTATPSVVQPFRVVQMPPDLYFPFLKLGDYYVNKERVGYLTDTNHGVVVHLAKDDNVVFDGEEAETLRAWLAANAEEMKWTTIDSLHLER